MPKQIVGSVHWIENGKQTSRLVDVQEAFSGLAQAQAQVLFAEASGDKKQIRLVRLAYRQFQGIRYRGENKAPSQRATTEVGKQRVSKAKKSMKARSKTKSLKKAGAKKSLKGGAKRK